MCFSLIVTLTWVFATGCKIKAPGRIFFRIVDDHAPKLGPQWQGAELPKTSLFLIGLLVFPIPHNVFPILHFVLPNGAKMDPKMIPGDPYFEFSGPKRLLKYAQRLVPRSHFTLASCSLFACSLPVSLLASCFLAVCFLAACFLAVCFLACLLACCLLASNSTVAGLAQPLDIYIYIYFDLRTWFLFLDFDR